MDFVKSYFFTNEPLTSWKKWWKNCSTGQRFMFICKEVTSHKIHTLVKSCSEYLAYTERKLNNHSHFQQYKSLATTRLLLFTNYRIWEGGSFLHIKSLSKKEIPRSLQESAMIERSGVSFIRKFIWKFENTAPPIMSK